VDGLDIAGMIVTEGSSHSLRISKVGDDVVIVRELFVADRAYAGWNDRATRHSSLQGPRAAVHSKDAPLNIDQHRSLQKIILFRRVLLGAGKTFGCAGRGGSRRFIWSLKTAPHAESTRLKHFERYQFRGIRD